MDEPAPDALPGAIPRAIADRCRQARERRGQREASASERCYDKGADGEWRLGRELNAAAWERGGFGVLHSLVLQDEQGDIDHLVIGPAGVTVVDSKAWSGRASLRHDKLRIEGRSKQDCIDGAHRQTERVRRVLSEAGRGDVAVDGVLCMVDANRGISTVRLEQVQGVGIATPGPVIAHATRPGGLSLGDMRDVHRVLSNRFTVRGGSIAPLPPTGPVPVAPRHAKPVLRRRRRSPRLLRAALALVLAASALLIGLAVLGGAAQALQPLPRHELLSRQGEYRELARQRAHGPVRGPRIIATATEFRLVYRRGDRCRVVVNVSRRPRLLARPAPVVRSIACRPVPRRR